ncbi:hypothetical protein EFT54_11315 [Lacticaseibacillus paracasei]|nr:hypothetical protein [Lacticaseibacillus paracasei]
MNTVSDNMVKGFKGYRKKPNYAKKNLDFFLVFVVKNGKIKKLKLRIHNSFFYKIRLNLPLISRCLGHGST